MAGMVALPPTRSPPRQRQPKDDRGGEEDREDTETPEGDEGGGALRLDRRHVAQDEQEADGTHEVEEDETARRGALHVAGAVDAEQAEQPAQRHGHPIVGIEVERQAPLHPEAREENYDL